MKLAVGVHGENFCAWLLTEGNRCGWSSTAVERVGGTLPSILGSRRCSWRKGIDLLGEVAGGRKINSGALSASAAAGRSLARGRQSRSREEKMPL